MTEQNLPPLNNPPLKKPLFRLQQQLQLEHHLAASKQLTGKLVLQLIADDADGVVKSQASVMIALLNDAQDLLTQIEREMKWNQPT